MFFSSSFTVSIRAHFLKSTLSDTDINAPFMLLFSFFISCMPSTKLTPVHLPGRTFLMNTCHSDIPSLLFYLVTFKLLSINLMPATSTLTVPNSYLTLVCFATFPTSICLICGICPPCRMFAAGFLQIPPRDARPYLRLCDCRY